MSAHHEVGDHVTTDGLNIFSIVAKRVTPESKSGVSFRLMPAIGDEWTDGELLRATTGFSHREAMEEYA